MKTISTRSAQVCCDFWFEASHVLSRDDWSEERNLEVFGKCIRLHGHSYHLRVTYRGGIDPDTGMVVNFREVKRRVREKVIDALDHRHVNDVLTEIPTAENIVCWIAERLLEEADGANLSRLELWETRNSCALLEGVDLDALRVR